MLNVFAALQNCTDLETVDVQDNYVKEQTADHLANLIKSNVNLKNLNLSDCNMTEEENEKVISALEHSTVLIEKFGYNYNSLSSEQATKLFDVMI